jgi:ferritin-like metal-binding protein YciE
MTTMTEPRDLFIHELRDVLYAEKTLEKALPKLAEEASDEELKAGFTEHLEQTKSHIENVKQILEELGETARAQRCPGIDGIKAEHDEFMEEQEEAEPEIKDLFLTGAGARAEHYEIAAYSGLIRLASSLGEERAARLLEGNLKDEQDALEKLEAAARRIGTMQASASSSR